MYFNPVDSRSGHGSFLKEDQEKEGSVYIKYSHLTVNASNDTVCVGSGRAVIAIAEIARTRKNRRINYSNSYISYMYEILVELCSSTVTAALPWLQGVAK